MHLSKHYGVLESRAILIVTAVGCRSTEKRAYIELSNPICSLVRSSPPSYIASDFPKITHYQRAVTVDPGESRLLPQEVLLAAAYPLSTGGSWRISLYLPWKESETVATHSSRRECFSPAAPSRARR